jgi:hypothetical protein
MGLRRIDAITQDDVERLGSSMLRDGLAPKTVRNVMAFLHAGFAHAEGKGWVDRNSYNVNTWSIYDIYANPNNNPPRFVDVHFADDAAPGR